MVLRIALLLLLVGSKPGLGFISKRQVLDDSGKYFTHCVAIIYPPTHLPKPRNLSDADNTDKNPSRLELEHN